MIYQCRGASTYSSVGVLTSLAESRTGDACSTALVCEDARQLFFDVTSQFLQIFSLPVHQSQQPTSFYSAKLTYGGQKFDHGTLLIRNKLHWLEVPETITYKLCLVTYKGIIRLFRQISASHSSTASRPWSSTSGHLLGHRTSTNTKLGDRGFQFLVCGSGRGCPLQCAKPIYCWDLKDC